VLQTTSKTPMLPTIVKSKLVEGSSCSNEKEDVDHVPQYYFMEDNTDQRPQFHPLTNLY
jgi:hypothetical protein